MNLLLSNWKQGTNKELNLFLNSNGKSTFYNSKRYTSGTVYWSPSGIHYRIVLPKPNWIHFTFVINKLVVQPDLFRDLYQIFTQSEPYQSQKEFRKWIAFTSVYSESTWIYLGKGFKGSPLTSSEEFQEFYWHAFNQLKSKNYPVHSIIYLEIRLFWMK